MGYGYNLLGQLTSQTYPSGRIIDTGYDAAARLSSVGQTGQSYANSFAYAGHGGLTSETWGNGAVHTLSYNERLQVKQIKLAVGGVEKQRFDYKYGEVDVNATSLNISPGNGLDTSKNTGQVAAIEGSIDGVRQWQQRFAYDKLGRLSTGKELTDNQTQTGSQAWRVDYAFDRWGNRYQAAGQGGVPVADTDIDKTRNRFVTVGSTLMVYDAAGNLTIDQKFRGMQFTYDTNGRMRRTDAANGYTTSVYDGAGQRVQTIDSVTNITRQSVYDAYGRVVADYENGVWKRDYIYRSESSVLLSTVEASIGTRYVMTDHQGSVRAVMNGTQITERHDYRPFGEELGSGAGLRTTGQGYNAQNPLRQQYALTERDSPTGLDNTWFRKLDSSAGRWTSPDPYLGSMSIGDPQSLNRYAYVENDPVNLVDPTGLDSFYIYCSWEELPDGTRRNITCVMVTVPGDVNVFTSLGDKGHSGGGGGGRLIQPIIDGNVGWERTSLKQLWFVPTIENVNQLMEQRRRANLAACLAQGRETRNREYVENGDRFMSETFGVNSAAGVGIGVAGSGIGRSARGQVGKSVGVDAVRGFGANYLIALSRAMGAELGSVRGRTIWDAHCHQLWGY